LISFIFFRLWDLGRRGFDFSGEISGIGTKNATLTGEGFLQNARLLVEKADEISPSHDAGRFSDSKSVDSPLIPRPTAQDTAGDSPQRLRGIGAGSLLAEQTPDLLPLKGKRTETALLSEGGSNASIELAQGYVSEQRAVNQRRQTLANDQPLAEGKESITENSRRGSATGRVESKTVSSSSTKKAATGKQEPR